MQYNRVARISGILRMIVQEPWYRQYLWKKVLGETRVVSSHLPERMASPIARMASHLNKTPSGRLENPISLLGFQIGYKSEHNLRYLIGEIFVDGCYSFHAQRPDPIILDCGSNIGISIMFFKALYPDARVIGFEPDPSTFEQLARNVRVNGLSGVELHNIALCEADRDIDFFTSDEEGDLLRMSAYQERLPGSRITVPARRLSTFIADQVDLIKMDIEGSEAGVLGELEASRALGRIDRIHLEYHHHIIPTQDSMSEILAILERNGFGYQILKPLAKLACPTSIPGHRDFRIPGKCTFPDCEVEDLDLGGALFQ